jgi:hypothetical protein
VRQRSKYENPSVSVKMECDQGTCGAKNPVTEILTYCYVHRLDEHLCTRDWKK